MGDDPTAPGAFAFADADRITGILTATGLTDPSTAPATAELWMGDDATEAAHFMRTTELGRAVFADAPPDLEGGGGGPGHGCVGSLRVALGSADRRGGLAGHRIGLITA